LESYADVPCAAAELFVVLRALELLQARGARTAVVRGMFAKPRRGDIVGFASRPRALRSPLLSRVVELAASFERATTRWTPRTRLVNARHLARDARTRTPQLRPDLFPLGPIGPTDRGSRSSAHDCHLEGPDEPRNDANEDWDELLACDEDEAPPWSAHWLHAQDILVEANPLNLTPEGPAHNMSPAKAHAKHQAWDSARKRHRLSHAHVQMAKELGMNPKKLGGLDNHRQEPWKAPLPQFIEELYLKRFGRERPQVVQPIEERTQLEDRRRAKRRQAKAVRRAAGTAVGAAEGAAVAAADGVAKGAANERPEE
jgi:hypothetical protein